MKPVLTLLVALAAMVLPTLSHAIEEPGYTVVRQLDGAEVRDHAPCTVARAEDPSRWPPVAG